MVPSLKHLSGNEVAINIACEENFKALLCQPQYASTLEEGYRHDFLRSNVFFELYKNPIYMILRNVISEHVVLLCLTQMTRWADFHDKMFKIPFKDGCKLIKRSFFTSKGLINKELAVRQLVKNTGITDSIRRSIASYYSFNIDEGVFSPLEFDLAIRSENEVAILSGLKSLDWKEKEEIVHSYRYTLSIHFIPRKKYDRFDFHYYLPFQTHLNLIKALLPLLNKNQVTSLFCSQNLLFRVLLNFLSFPYHHSFMYIVEQTWKILNKMEFYLLLHKIADFMCPFTFRNSCDYHLIFIDFWNKFPLFKRFVFRFETSENYRHTVNREYNYMDFEGGISIFRLIHGDNYLLEKIFSSHFNNDDEYVLQILLRDATSEEKLLIEESHLQRLWSKTVHIKNLRPLVVFIKCCVPEERVLDFKTNFVSMPDTSRGLWIFILYGKLKEVQQFINWALFDKKNDSVINNFLSQVDKDFFGYISVERIKFIDRALKWILSSDDIEDYKKIFLLNVEDLAFKNPNNSYYYLLLDEHFETIDFYLNWVFSSQEAEIKKFKKELCLKYNNCYLESLDVRKDLEKVEGYIKWSELSEEDGRDLKKRFAFNDKGVKYCHELFVRQELDTLDALIKWCELSDEEIKSIKKSYIYDENKQTLCIDLLLYNELQSVDKIFKWAQFSDSDVGKFYCNFLEELDLHKYLIERNIKLDIVKKFFSELPLPQEEVKSYKKSLGLKSSAIIEKYATENELDEADAFLNWCFSSEEEICEFKEKFPLSESFCVNACIRYIMNNKFDDADTFLTWTGMNERSKVDIVKKIQHDDIISKIVVQDLFHNNGKIVYFLKWLHKYGTSLDNWKECFLTWCSDKKIKKCMCEPLVMLLINRCSLHSDNDPFGNLHYSANNKKRHKKFCKKLNSSLSDVEKYRTTIDKHINALKELQKVKCAK